jgi:hypothetical protein
VSWVPWTHQRLAAATGYGAGVRSPGWYDHVFRHPGPEGVARFFVDAATLLRGADIAASPEHLIAATRTADTLAVLRGRPRPGLDEVLDAADARPYSGALGVENPISRGRATPVLDQMAEGWGTMTVKPDQRALGAGRWKNGAWSVVITRPLASDDVNAPQLAPGDRTVAGFAVWEGEHREVGARKAWAPWIPLVIAR